MMINLVHFKFDNRKPCLRKGLTEGYAIIDMANGTLIAERGNWPVS